MVEEDGNRSFFLWLFLDKEEIKGRRGQRKDTVIKKKKKKVRKTARRSRYNHVLKGVLTLLSKLTFKAEFGV